MSKSRLKSQALQMRKNGASLKDIVDRLGIAKSTASFWCREIDLTDIQRNRLFEKMVRSGHVGRLLGAEANRNKKIISRETAHQEMKNKLSLFTDRDRFISGISLYWAEGSKADSSSGFLFVNSDPAMIKLMYNWLVDFMDVRRGDIYIKISINQIHRYRENKVLNYWANLLDLPLNQFSNTFFMKTVQKKIYNNQDTYYGVCRLGVRRSSYLRYRMMALINIIKAGVAQVVRASHS